METLPNVATLKYFEYFEADFKPVPLKHCTVALFYIPSLVMLSLLNIRSYKIFLASIARVGELHVYKFEGGDSRLMLVFL